MNTPIEVDYYTDLLCVWAWVAQTHVDKLNQEFQDKLVLRHHYMDLFGDTQAKMNRQWSERGHFQGFAEHVQHVASSNNLTVHPQLWKTVKPSTSANAHLVIKAVELNYGQESAIDIAFKMRQGFFEQALDISQLSVLFELTAEQGHNNSELQKALDNGQAMAKLCSDYQQAKSLSLQGSPTFILDNGRQMLYGNLRYDVLATNIHAHLD